MTQTETRILPVLQTIRETYDAFRANLRHHLILSYVFYLPFCLFLLMPGLTLPKYITQPGGQVTFGFTGPYLVFILVAFLLTSTLTLLFFRLYLVGSDGYLKVSLSGLARMLLKYILYLAAMVILLLIFMLVMSVGIGLVMSIIAGITGWDVASQSNRTLALLIGMLITVVTVGISFRLQSTFVSIAENKSFVSFREAWFYSRNNSLAIFITVLACVVPAWLLSLLLLNGTMTFFNAGQAATVNNAFIIVQYLLSPVIFAPTSLFCSCLTIIYRYLTGKSGTTGHIADLIV
ncbi:hypothetical protein [Emcibacter sp.]|uniref:hypothetical protein n=1 Tax=Emcibacter sp. TaxID=1979954 RepID=UPI002AA6ACF9|nr:hypothetical protein [Emcibacter sp.]